MDKVTICDLRKLYSSIVIILASYLQIVIYATGNRQLLCENETLTISKPSFTYSFKAFSTFLLNFSLVHMQEILTTRYFFIVFFHANICFSFK